MMSNKNIKYYSDKYNLDNEKWHLSILKAAQILYPNLSYLIDKFGTNLIWKSFSKLEISEEGACVLFKKSIKYYNNFLFI